MEEWETFGRIKNPPIAPKPPRYLALWMELQRWPGTLLIDGGLMDQPAWIWELVDMAGMVYSYLTAPRKPSVGDDG